VDLSALIFVALAVAWAVYLIPKALKHHDDVVRSRSVDRFSHTMRVLARREPVSRRDARLVVAPGRAASAPVVTTKGVQPDAARPEPVESRREATQRATRRRRRVLGLILLANLATGVLAAIGYLDYWYAAIPAVLLIAWLVACRLMVRREQAWTPSARIPGEREEEEPRLDAARLDEPVATADVDDAETGQIPAVTDPSLWDPMPVTLPTYVSKPAAAPRLVRTIDLDSAGVWTSGRTDADSQIAREADEAARAKRQRGDGHRAVGS
jgi:hypothetical protein